jgi:diguanylate cyclase (GGDEF)-like protein
MSPEQTTAPEPPLWRRIWSAPEAEISSAGFGGELLVASVRLAIVFALLFFPIRELLLRRGASDPLALLATATLGLLLALVVYSAAHRNWGRSWIGFASSVLDVSLVSAMLGVLLFLGRPVEATNNLAIFPIYFLAIAATSLRYDVRICLLTGALAIVQYAALIAYADWHWHLHAIAFAPLAQLTGATLMAATLVIRARELRLLSTRDRFTGLLNRAVFSEQLEREVAFARREDGRFAVAMLDIDHFKKFNDTYGHAGGDQALRVVAKILRDTCRSTDVVARYGGEEFALILPGVMSGRATDLLERFRRVIAIKPIHLSNRPQPASVTVSIGVAIWPDDGDTPAALLRCADQRLYQAKEQGRDRVVGPTPHHLPRPTGETRQPTSEMRLPVLPPVPPEG